MAEREERTSPTLGLILALIWYAFIIFIPETSLHTFVEEHLSPDGHINPETIAQIQGLRLSGSILAAALGLFSIYALIKGISLLSLNKTMLIFALLVSVFCGFLYGLASVFILAISHPSLLIFGRLFDISLIALLTLLAISLGERLLRVMRIETASFLERTAFAFGLGLGIISYLLLLLALFHLLYVWAIIVLLAVLSILSIKPAASWLAALPSEAKGLLRELKSPWLLLFAALGGITIMSIGIRALLPPSEWDSLMYHLPVAKEFLKAHTIIPFYDDPPANNPALMRLLYTIGIAARSDALGGLLSAATTLFTALAVAAFAARFFSRRLGLIAFSVFLAADVVAEVAITARIDMALTFYVFLGIYAVFIHLEAKEKEPLWRSGWLVIGAVAIAFALGIKYTAIFWLGAIPLWLFWERLIKKPRAPRRWLQEAIIFSLLVVAVAGYWYLKNWLWLGNPVYPRIWGGKGWAPFIVPHTPWWGEHGFYGTGRGVTTYFINLWKLFREPGWFYIAQRHYINYLFILLPLYLFLKKRHPVNTFLFLSGLYYIFWNWSGQNIRYLLPLFPLLSVATAYVLNQMTVRPRLNISLLKNFVPLAALIIMGVNTKLQCDMTESLSPWKYLAGLKSEEYILERAYPYHYFLPAVEYINDNLPLSEKILMLYDARTYYIKPAAISDPRNINWGRLITQFSSNEEIYLALRSRGITHLLFNHGALAFYVRRGTYNEQWAERVRQSFLSFGQDYLQLAFEKHGYELYRLTEK